MASRISPYVDNTGLVFAYDLANIKRSYLGEPTVNLVISPDGNANVITSDIPPQTNVIGFAQYSSGYFVNPRNTTNTAATGKTFTYSVWMRSRSATSSTYLMYVYTGTGPDGGWWYFGDGPLTQDWNKYSYSRSDMTGTISQVTVYRYNQLGTIDIAAPQIEEKTHPTQFTAGTRSVTQGLKDLTGRSTIDLTNVSFDANAQITFDGTDDHILTSENITLNGSQTFEVITTISGGPQSPAGIISNHDYANTSNFGLNHISSNRIGISIGYTDNTREYDSKYTTYAATIGTPFHLVMTFDQPSNTVKLYVNGALDSTFVLTKTVKFTNRPIVLGRWDYQYNYYYFNGKVPVAKVYNRALPASEIQQNFNAIKGRYGL
jgi:hypothetical protein